ncbi:mechanosensitive ion channel [Diaphorobacter ruginosibacter]|uniref:Mechanosensitive ion channel n=1 Tax=Diaphorobacter ruginosibacter TaxID=1715720 RepID=A0A7G9RSL9_9BURK|nr:mechanosensitive ion channel domain-containing protein [Diaphorobacter ruginosibacter]QNN58594.1 mechanosensitive ion channel [Diaphorobacter ruginosibacter]
MEWFDTLSREFREASTWVELGVIVAGVVLAYMLSSMLARRVNRPESLWFGPTALRGVMFPLLSLVLVYIANVIVGHIEPVFFLPAAVSVLTSIVLIRWTAKVLAAAFPSSGLARLVERVFSWCVVLVAVLWIAGLLPVVLKELDGINLAFGKTNVSLLTLIRGSLTAGLMLVATLWISATFERRVLDQTVNDLSMRKVLINVTRALLVLVGLLFALSAVGVDLTALSVLGGAMGVGLGFGMQKLAANYVSGFVILLERSLRIGDNVRVDGFEGRITDIKTRYTLIRAGNGRESIVPNESIITQRVENLSAADMRFNVTTNIGVGYDSDVAQVRRILADAAKAQPRVLSSPEPVAYLVNFGADAIEFSLNFWISDPAAGVANLKSDVNIALLEGLRAAGISIPYPQRVLHLADAAAAAAGTILSAMPQGGEAAAPREGA